MRRTWAAFLAPLLSEPSPSMFLEVHLRGALFMRDDSWSKRNDSLFKRDDSLFNFDRFYLRVVITASSCACQ